MFTTINRTKNWMKTVFLSTIISLSVCLYIKVLQDKSLIPLFLQTTNKKSQHSLFLGGAKLILSASKMIYTAKTSLLQSVTFQTI